MCREDLVSVGVCVCVFGRGGGVGLYRLNIYVEMWVDIVISVGIYIIGYSIFWY